MVEKEEISMAMVSDDGRQREGGNDRQSLACRMRGVLLREVKDSVLNETECRAKPRDHHVRFLGRFEVGFTQKKTFAEHTTARLTPLANVGQLGVIITLATALSLNADGQMRNQPTL